MITLIDYGVGNIRSVQKAFELSGQSVMITSDPSEVEKADRLVLPGVAAFGDAMKNLRERNLVDPILKFVSTGRPFIGICVGLQLLFSESEEKGTHQGLGLIPGKVLKFSSDLKVPQIGWNQVRFKKDIALFKGVPDNAHFYFVHSYYALPDYPEDIAGETEYGITYASIVSRDNVFGAQFHPEKSQKAGLKLIDNFCRM